MVSGFSQKRFLPAAMTRERLLLVQRVRRRQHDALDGRVGERLVEVVLERELVRLPELRDVRRRLRIDAVEHLETRAPVEAA